MLNLFRKFLRPTLREQLEDGLREALRRYAERHAAPNLRVFVSTDLVPEGLDADLWARDEGEHLRRFALQWAEDNHVPRAGLRVEVVMLDTKREFAFVKPLGIEPADGNGGGRGAAAAPTRIPSPPRPLAPAPTGGSALLEVVESPSLTQPLRVEEEVTLGRRAAGTDVVGTGDRYMSGRHARFHVAGGEFYVTDLDSKNRTFVNDRAIAPHQPVAVRAGDLIRMGTTTLRVVQVGG
jgi:hypothetical protein